MPGGLFRLCYLYILFHRIRGDSQPHFCPKGKRVLIKIKAVIVSKDGNAFFLVAGAQPDTGNHVQIADIRTAGDNVGCNGRNDNDCKQDNKIVKKVNGRQC